MDNLLVTLCDLKFEINDLFLGPAPSQPPSGIVPSQSKPPTAQMAAMSVNEVKNDIITKFNLIVPVRFCCCI